MAEADPKFHIEAAAEPAAKTWLDYMADGRAWAHSLHAGSSANLNSYAVEKTAHQYADMHAPAKVKAAHFAAAKAARDLEFAR